MPAPQSWIAAYRTCAPSPTRISVIASLNARVRSGEAYRSMNVTSAPASTTINVREDRASSTSTYQRLQRQVDPRRGHVQERATGSEGAVHRGEARALGWDEIVQRALDEVGYSAAAASRSVKITPFAASVGSRCVTMTSESCWICRPARPPMSPAAFRTRRHAVEVLSSARPPAVYGANVRSRSEVGVAPLLGLLRRDRQGFEVGERLSPQVAREPGDLGQACQGAFVEGVIAVFSRPSLPSAARRGGSARPRTPSATRA